MERQEQEPNGSEKDPAAPSQVQLLDCATAAQFHVRQNSLSVAVLFFQLPSCSITFRNKVVLFTSQGFRAG